MSYQGFWASIEISSITKLVAVHIQCTTQYCSTTKEVITTAFYGNYWSYASGERIHVGLLTALDHLPNLRLEV